MSTTLINLVTFFVCHLFLGANDLFLFIRLLHELGVPLTSMVTNLGIGPQFYSARTAPDTSIHYLLTY